MNTPCPKRLRPLSSAALAAAALLWPALAWSAAGKPADKPADQQAATAPAMSAAPGAPAVVDPLEVLRQRLADKLAGRAVQSATPAEVRVVANTPVPAAAGKPVSGRTSKDANAAVAGSHAKAVSARTSAKGAGPGTVHGVHGAHGPWSYQGAAGPAAWGGIKPEYSLCGNGQRQSPIDIRGGLAVDLEPVKFNYQASRFGVVDNGHTVQVNLASGNTIEVGGKRFELQQFHFHRPSEERIDGRQFEMSLHLVHKDEQGRLAVVALLFDKGPAHAELQKVWAHIPLERGDEMAARVPLELSALLPADKRYYTYMGSLTTPPCSEGVQWIVMRQPVTLTPEQIEIFARIYPMNARPVQAAAGRRIMQSQ
jgi:carbonic anhydrase